MTTETPTVPAWLNLDAIYSPELRTEAAELISEVREQVPALLALATRMRKIETALEESEDNAPQWDSVVPEIRRWAGVAGINELAGILDEAFGITAEGLGCSRDYLREMCKNQGVNWPSDLLDLDDQVVGVPPSA